MTAPSTEWQAVALCRDEDPELFFPIGSSGPALSQTQAAVRVCLRCSVTDACLAWALDHHQDAGVWGGLTEDERRSLLRRRRTSAPVRG
jgi:WhiB family redox-sensing transcriptional regulator